jgi:predicted nucleotidyltransferase
MGLVNGKLDRLMKILSKKMDIIKGYKVKKIGIFGSVANGTAKKGSDIDILVEFEEGGESFTNLVHLHQFLEETVGGKVDLVTANGLSPYIGPYILKEVRFIEAAA